MPWKPSAHAEERRIDLGVAGDRVLVNTVSLGANALLVGTAGYRERKVETAVRVLPAVLGPDAEPVDLLFTGPDGQERGKLPAHPGLQRSIQLHR